MTQSADVYQKNHLENKSAIYYLPIKDQQVVVIIIIKSFWSWGSIKWEVFIVVIVGNFKVISKYDVW